MFNEPSFLTLSRTFLREAGRLVTERFSGIVPLVRRALGERPE